MRMTTPVALPAVIGLFSVCISARCGAQATLTKIADTDTSIPGGTGSFTGFGTASHYVSYERSTVFIGFGGNGQAGIYAATAPYTSPLLKAVDRSTAMPGGSTTFASFQSAANDGGALGFGPNGLFRANAGTPDEGIYAVRLRPSVFGQTRKIAGLGTIAPGGTTAFTGFGQVTAGALSDGQGSVRYFKATTSGGEGIYSITGDDPNFLFGRRVDTTMTSPVGEWVGHFSAIGEPSFRPSEAGGNIIQYARAAFRGIDELGPGVWGLDNLSTNPVVRYVRAGDPIPGGVGAFTDFSNVSAASNKIAFVGYGAAGTPSAQGIYVGRNSPRFNSKVADLATQVPGAAPGVQFTGFESVAASDVALVPNAFTEFVGHAGDGREGLYFFDGQDLHGVLDTTMQVDGKRISDIRLESQAFDEWWTSAVDLTFADGSRGLYYVQAQAPEPAATLFLVVPVLLRARARRLPRSRRSR